MKEIVKNPYPNSKFTIGLFRALSLLCISSVLVFVPVLFPVQAVNEDLQRPNNKFGIHIAKPHDEDIRKAAELVNGNGGAWGYVTVVMREDELNKAQWQEHFNMMRELQLIPIVRLATRGEGDNWRRPSADEAKKWGDFLDSLKWPVKNRYVLLFNEPNHAQEWGGAADPYTYAEVAEAFAADLKSRSSDYVIMLAGLDAAAPQQPPRFMDSAYYLDVVIKEMGSDRYQELFCAFASHSYPNPGFVGSPGASGKGTVRSYEVELEQLKRLGVTKTMPVFITETGWDGNAIGRDRAAEYFRNVYENVWGPDDRIRAVTPFILNYQGEPFLKFSWRKFQSEEMYPQFDVVRDLSKTYGSPKIDESGSMRYRLPSRLTEKSNFHFLVQLKNTGQGYWDTDQRYRLEIEGVSEQNYLVSDLVNIKPDQTRDIDIYINTEDPTGTKEAKIVLYRDQEKVLEGPVWRFQVLALPSLEITTGFFPKRDTTSNQFELQVFDEKEELVFRRKDVTVSDGIGEIEAIRNVAFGETYRVVILHPGYLPRQVFITFNEGENLVEFERMWPFDFDNSGGLTWGDFPALFQDLGQLGKLLP